MNGEYTAFDPARDVETVARMIALSFGGTPEKSKIGRAHG